VHVFNLAAAECARPDPPWSSCSAPRPTRFRAGDVVPFDEEDESPFVGLLQVEAA
jgi:hypothetical protein